MEIALFVQKRLASGDNQAEIARRLGKSRQYVTLATALIEPPDWLLDAYRQGRCKGMTELYELRRLHGEHAERVEAWALDREPMTRERIATLKRELSQPSIESADAVESAPTIGAGVGIVRERSNRVKTQGRPKPMLRLRRWLDAGCDTSRRTSACTSSSTARTSSSSCRWHLPKKATCTCDRSRVVRAGSHLHRP